MRTLIQIVILFFCPIVVYRAFHSHAWWGLLGIVGFLFAYFWSRHAKVKKDEHFFRQILFSTLVTGIVSLVMWYFLR
jgi:hypothetical protein